jgi:hypothetical protein
MNSFQKKMEFLCHFRLDRRFSLSASGGGLAVR